MRNVTVGLCVSAILAGCGGGGGSETPSASGPTSTPSAVVVKDPLKIISGTSYDAGDGGLNPRWVIADFNKDGNKDIFLRYDPESAFSTTSTGTSPVRFFLGKNSGGFEQSTSIFAEGYAPTLVNRIIIDDFNGDGGTDIAVSAAGQDPYLNGEGVVQGHGGDYTQILTYSPNGYKLSKISNSPLTFGHHISSGDINGDYLPDAIVTSMMYTVPFFVMGDRNSNYVADKTRFATGTFDTQVSETFPDLSRKKWQEMRFTSTAVVDANNDGKMDIAMFSAGGAKTSVVFLNDGSGHFSKNNMMDLPVGPYGEGYFYTDKTKTYEVGTIILDSLAVDVNNDGKKDLISITTQANSSAAEYVYYRGAALQILINNGNGFTDETKQRSNFVHNANKNFTHYDTIEFADVNNDKCKDILLHRAQVNYNDSANPTRILINDCKGNFTEKAYPKSLPVGILTVIGDGHYAILTSTKDGNKYTQRVDDVYYDWSLGQSLFP